MITNPSTPVPLPKYQCHKIVQALHIGKIEGGRIYSLEDESIYVDVSNDYITKHTLNLDGYYVRYEDGYESWSPAAAFEAGYTKI